MESEDKEAKVADFLSTGLSDWQSIAGDLQFPARRRTDWLRPRALAGVAAALILTLLLTSLYVPHLTRAISAIPVVGPAYERLLERSGSSIAYSAGLLSELNLVAKSGDMSVTVLGAYTDPLVTVVTLKVQLDNGTTKTLYSEQSHRALSISLRGRWDRFWRTADSRGVWEYDEVEDELYYSYQTKTVPWWVGNSVTLQVESDGATVELQVPLQRLPAKDVETVIISKPYLDGKLVIDKLVLSPGRTLVYWTGSDGYHGNPTVTPGDGSELRELGSWIVRKNPRRWNYVVSATHQYYKEYLPTKSARLVIDMGHFFQNSELLLPLNSGATASNSYVEAKLDEVRVGDGKTEFVVSWANRQHSWDVFMWTLKTRDSGGVSPDITAKQVAPGKLLLTWPLELRDDHIASYKLSVLFHRNVEGSDQFSVSRP